MRYCGLMRGCFTQAYKSPATVLELPNERALWDLVEALALRTAGWQGAFIRVKNARGDTVVRAGIRVRQSQGP